MHNNYELRVLKINSNKKFLKSFYKIEHDELGLLLSLFGLESVVFVFVVGLSGKSFDTSAPFHAKFCLVMS